MVNIFKYLLATSHITRAYSKNSFAQSGEWQNTAQNLNMFSVIYAQCFPPLLLINWNYIHKLNECALNKKYYKVSSAHQTYPSFARVARKEVLNLSVCVLCARIYAETNQLRAA